MTRLALILLTGCAAPHFTDDCYLDHGRPGPHEQAIRVAERTALDADHTQRVRLEALRVHRHRLATNQIVNMPPLPQSR